MNKNDELCNKPDANKYFREWALAFIWYSRRQKWRINRLEKDLKQTKQSNHQLVEHNYVLMKQLTEKTK